MLILIGLIIGFVFGILSPLYIPSQYSQYIAIAILAILDSVFGGIKASLQGNFNTHVFLSGFFGNTFLAAFLTYIGKKLDVDIYLVGIIVFGTRLFKNFAIIRRFLLNKLQKDGKINI